MEAERDQADKLIADVFADAASNNIRLAEASHRAKAAEAKLAEVEAERDRAIKWARTEHANADRYAACAESAEAHIAHLENHIESVAKDTHKIMVAYYEAALPAVYRLGLEAAAKRVEARAAGNPLHVGQYANSAFVIRRLPTLTAAELMAGINKGDRNG